MPHDWLQQEADYYEEVEVDHRAKDPALKKAIRLQPDKVQHREMRKALPGLGWGRFLDVWKPGDLILASRQEVRDPAQELLFQRHKDHFQDTLVPLLYHPKDSRKQNIQVTIPGTNRREELVLNEVVDVSIEAAEAAIQTDDWRLGYALTVHSSQGLTIHDPQKVWIVDDYLQWSNLADLAVSRVEDMHQLERVVCPLEEGSEVRPLTEQQVRKSIAKKLVAYKRQDQAKGLRFNLKVDHILHFKEAQNNRCRLQTADAELGEAAAAVDTVELQDFGQTAKEASDAVHKKETTFTDVEVDELLGTANDTPFNLGELRGLDRALQTIQGELTNNLAKLSELDEHIALEKRKLDQTNNSEGAADEFTRRRIAERLRDLQGERDARLEAAWANREALRSQINRMRETITRALHKDTSSLVSKASLQRPFFRRPGWQSRPWSLL
ncbi:hypothetical protein scyTo_0003475 [Scyliorhinus torazame]|uniref:Uncharacterized protein n=1 Tax=Scyliorhinus torazame TaxID=75743 RepID=A0A401PMQ6_SCYTO|nr:hypothetical protein [Scyliorhinus torazame]